MADFLAKTLATSTDFAKKGTRDFMASGGKFSGVMPPAIILTEADLRTEASWSEDMSW